MMKARTLFLLVLFVGLALVVSTGVSLGQTDAPSGAVSDVPGPVPDSTLIDTPSHAIAIDADLAAKAWQTETVDSAGNTGLYTSLALDMEDHPHISYYEYNNADLRYAYHDGSAWTTDTVEGSGTVGTYTSLVLDSAGQPHIGYCGVAAMVPSSITLIKYATYDGSAWVTETVASAGDGGGYTSLALDSGDGPHLGYFHGSAADLMYAYRDGGGWLTETVDSAGDGGGYVSLALDGNNYPHISYYTSRGHKLRFFKELKA
jgi:hypothetical protein